MHQTDPLNPSECPGGNTASPRPAGEAAPETADFGYRRIPAREKPGYVRRHFTAIATKYDFMNSLLSLGLHHLWKRRAVEALGLKAGERVLDVCGGTADLSLLAARIVGPAGRVFLCDINWEMIVAGRPKISRAPLEQRLLCVQSDAESLAFPAGTFDCVMVGFGVRNLTHMDRGLAEMHRVLKPGGRFMCLEFSLPAGGWFRFLYDFYSFRFMPLAGRLLAGNRDAYLHLPESIRRFPAPDRFAGLLEETGFAAVTWHRLTRGIVVVYTGVKP
jgi:demethylmenaquinone methyltransferase/2-methoxy-6-polyprenyl-1,4-benzoquinol methylase